MKDFDFIKQLKEELPLWIARGWIQPQYEQAILNYVNSKQSVSKPANFAFGLFGIILILVGIVSFFAANWVGITKLQKLIILFVSMWLSYGVSGYLYQLRKKTAYITWLAEIILLLAVVLFGTNVFLISQIYHIDAHFPNGLLIVSLGAWLTAVLLQSSVCMGLAIGMAYLWTFLEGFQFWYAVHWPFLLLFAALLIPILKFNWRKNLHLLLIAFIFWLEHNLIWLKNQYYQSPFSYQLFYINSIILASFIIFTICMSLKDRFKSLTDLTITVEHYSSIYLLLFFFHLTFPEFLMMLSKEKSWNPYLFLPIMLLLGLISVTLFVWAILRKVKLSIEAKQIGLIASVALPMLLLINQFNISSSFLSILYNILFVGLIGWFLLLGHEIQNKIYVNLSFLFFSLFIYARYFDVFWPLLNRSIFFMLGGIILMIGSYYLEKKRRKFTQRLEKECKPT